MKVLIVDDEDYIIEELSELMEMEGHSTIPANCGEEALQSLRSFPDIDLMIFDINMPGTSGLELNQELSSLADVRSVVNKLHTICMTGSRDLTQLMSMMTVGVDGFQFKPIDVDELLRKVRSIAIEVSMAKENNLEKATLTATIERRESEVSKLERDLLNAQRQGLNCLAYAAEHKDSTTGQHIERIGAYARHLAECIGWDKKRCDLIELAAPLHDVGKIGTPDNVLNHPGGLSKSQFDVMKNHAIYGAEILGRSDSAVMKMAAKIAHCHHERWDGTGYPRGLKGSQIPPEAAITSLVDVYDALRSARPYKDDMAHAAAIDIMCNGDGRTSPKHFSPELLMTFLANHREFDKIYQVRTKTEAHEDCANVTPLQSLQGKA